MRSSIEQSSPVIVERAEDAGDKEKKKNKRRSSRRSKQSSPVTASSSVSETLGESSNSLGNGSKTKNHVSSMSCSSSRQPESDVPPLSEHGPTMASNVAFNSMPTMHLNKRAEDLLPPDLGRSAFAMSCSEPIVGGGPVVKCTNKDLLSFHQYEGHAESKLFARHWSVDAANEALEKGDVFKALFHVNAHNRLEAYCKIEGVPTDVLISGTAAQNRAVEGDVVVIKVDPLSFWTKMKGLNGPNNSRSADDSNLLLEANDTAGSSCKDKSKVDADREYADSGSSLSPQKGFRDEDCSYASEATNQELNGTIGYNFVNGFHHPSTSDSSHVVSSAGQNEALNCLGRLCAMISSYPSKRPTGRVVCIIERSPRRGAIVGFLNVKQWLNCRGWCKKDTKRNKSSLLVSNREYIELMPTDPKFPKMIVLVRDLPGCIKKRLEAGDVTVEMELVAAQIDSWGEESPFPKAHVSHLFGRGSEMGSQIDAILYENAICCSDFSAESLSCLPHNNWEVPKEELQSRRDLRHLCIFTIDPSTAVDLDDALSVERLPDGKFRVGVHIADVSYFVLPDTALDMEAQIRSTTVYMLQRKLPMLPPLLSENVGSLSPGVDRLAFSIFWTLNSSGNIVDRWIGHTVVRSCCKLSYEHAQYIVDGLIDLETYDNTFADHLPQLHGHIEWADVIRSVKCLYDISKSLREKRFNDGALQLENSNIVFLFDEYGIPYDCMLCECKDSNLMVEEFMLLANMTAAEIISRAFPDCALLRRHPEPNMRKLREFETFCSKHGLEVDTSSGHFNKSLECIREKLKDDSVLIDILISYASRPMQLATYFCSGDMKVKVNDWGHYALAVPLYTHFTSPLRRYPDIVVHRTLAAAIEAEELYMKQRKVSNKARRGEVARCFTGICFDKDAAVPMEGREALSAAALKHRVPSTEVLTDVVAHCNERKLASRHVKDACDKLYMWALLKKKEVLLSEARVLGLGPKFMSIYVNKLALERRIYYDEVEGLKIEWLEATSTLVLNLYSHKRSLRKASSGYYRGFDEVVLVINPCDLKTDPGMVGESAMHLENTVVAAQHLESEIDPAVFPLTIRPLSTIPVALQAVGGDDGPPDIGVRLFMSTYFS